MIPERAETIVDVFASSETPLQIESARFDDGRTVMLIRDTSRSLELRFLDPTGAQVNGGGEIVAAVSNWIERSSIAVLADQTLVVVWSEVGRELPGGGGGVIAERFDAYGKSLGPAFSVNASALNDQTGPFVSGLPDGGFVVAWTDHKANGVDPIIDKIMSQRFDGTGAKVGAELQVSSGEESFASDITVLRDGKYIVAWTDYDEPVGPGQFRGNVKGQIFDIDGIVYGEQFIFSEITSSSQSGVQLESLPNGGFVAAWNNFSGDGDLNVKSRFFSADGVATSAEILVNSIAEGRQILSSLNAFEDGGIAITWRDGDNSVSGLTGKFQLYNVNGQAVGEETLVSADGNDIYESSLVIGDSLNSFSVIWIGDSSGIHSGVKYQKFEGGDGILTANAAGSVLVGTGFNEMLIGARGNDTLLAGFGSDLLNGGAGNDVLNGGGGIDTGSYANATKGVTVDLALSGAQFTGDGRDTLISIENLTGSNFIDRLRGDGNANILDGGAGNDALFGLGGNDTLIGGDGNDTLDGGVGVDSLTGGDGNDTYVVDDTNDTVVELVDEGTDLVKSTVTFALSDNVEKLTFTGSASVDGTGNTLANTIVGNEGDNVLRGLAGKDTLNGGLGNDTLIGGAGADTLTGGGGADKFVFDILETAVNRDTIKDFVSGSDKIEISRSAFAAFASAPLGALAASAFHVGTSAATTDQHLVYNAATGALYYDADGLGGLAQIQIATLAAHPAITSGDFLLAG